MDSPSPIWGHQQYWPPWSVPSLEPDLRHLGELINNHRFDSSYNDDDSWKRLNIFYFTWWSECWLFFFSLQDLDRELEEICDKRRRLDDDNEARKKEIENLSVTFVKARAKNDRLKAEHNAVLANQIFLTARSDQIYAISFFLSCWITLLLDWSSIVSSSFEELRNEVLITCRT